MLFKTVLSVFLLCLCNVIAGLCSVASRQICLTQYFMASEIAQARRIISVLEVKTDSQSSSDWRLSHMLLSERVVGKIPH